MPYGLLTNLVITLLLWIKKLVAPLVASLVLTQLYIGGIFIDNQQCHTQSVTMCSRQDDPAHANIKPYIMLTVSLTAYYAVNNTNKIYKGKCHALSGFYGLSPYRPPSG